MHKRIVLTLIVVLSLAGVGRAQEHPNLSGTWQLNLTKSDYGDMQGPNSRTDVIEQHGDNIREQVKAEGRHKIQQYTLDFATDNQKTVLPSGSEIRMGTVTLMSISAHWQGSSLVILQGLRFQDSNLTAKYTYTLSSDGKTLTMTLSLNGSDTAATFVFDRRDRPVSTAESK